MSELQRQDEEQQHELQETKADTKKQNAQLRALLTESGDKLKDAVIEVLTEIWKLNAKDMDPTRKTKLKEDVLIQDKDQSILAEVKGTRNKNPTFAHVTQVLTHKFLSEHKNANAALILNHDLTTDPLNRTEAYTDPDEEQQLRRCVWGAVCGGRCVGGGVRLTIAG
ncbi:MAG TPA: hypothetical protein VGQ81_02270 [Acidobacteriota bacterium]|jgi:hypothetical protein|nr:hypothetical protein [Acidobacteriota bacterium]